VEVGLHRHCERAGRRKAPPDFIDKDEKKWSQLVKASGVEQE
jgi:hypothetical protein